MSKINEQVSEQRFCLLAKDEKNTPTHTSVVEYLSSLDFRNMCMFKCFFLCLIAILIAYSVVLPNNFSIKELLLSKGKKI